MLARQVRVAPLSLVAARFSSPKSKFKPRQNQYHCAKTYINIVMHLPLE
jgi:hypothetical protein